MDEEGLELTLDEVQHDSGVHVSGIGPVSTAIRLLQWYEFGNPLLQDAVLDSTSEEQPREVVDQRVDDERAGLQRRRVLTRQ